MIPVRAVLAAMLVLSACSSGVAAEEANSPETIDAYIGATLVSSPCPGAAHSVADCISRAEQGDALAQEYLGGLYYSGVFVAQDYSAAIGWYRKAAEQGNAHAQLGLGEMYYNGKGSAQDYSAAIAWFRKAAVQGNGRAQIYLGGMYAEGKGSAQDYGAAIGWLRKAAVQGYVIPTCIDHDPWAHLRRPIVMMCQG